MARDIFKDCFPGSLSGEVEAHVMFAFRKVMKPPRDGGNPPVSEPKPKPKPDKDTRNKYVKKLGIGKNLMITPFAYQAGAAATIAASSKPLYNVFEPGLARAPSPCSSPAPRAPSGC